MPWLQIHFHIKPADAETLEQHLSDLGACAITLTDAADQPLLEPLPGETPLWDRSIISALFEASAHPESILSRLAQQWPGELPAHQLEKLEDQDWERAWIDDFKPMRFGDRIWIVPSWCEPPDASAINLRLDPGLAFGTGTHETTALCLEWLDAHPSDNKKVLDYGCGSGVLALAALLDNAESALGCDLDPQALTASQNNAKENGLSIKTVLPKDMPPASANFDLVLANILAGPLAELAPILASHCRPNGQVVLSGILSEQADQVQNTYSAFFDMDPICHKGDWVRLSGKRKA